MSLETLVCTFTVCPKTPQFVEAIKIIIFNSSDVYIALESLYYNNDWGLAGK